MLKRAHSLLLAAAAAALLPAAGCATARPAAAKQPSPLPVLLPQAVSENAAAFPFSTANPGNLPCARLRVNGVEGLFILDTGAMVTALDPEFADKAGLTERLHQAGATINNRGNGVDFAFVPELKAGKTSFRRFHALLLDLSNLTHGLDAKPAGILGANLLFHAPFTMDYAAGTAAWNAPAPAGAVRVPAAVSPQAAFLGADLDGRRVALLADTGSTFNFLLFADWNGETREGGEMSAVRAGEASREKIVMAGVKEMKLGDAVFPKPEFRLNPTHRCLGTEFFKGRVLRIDARKGTVEIAAPAPGPSGNKNL